jgi:peptide/nickel transport system ATP-binding protein
MGVEPRSETSRASPIVAVRDLVVEFPTDFGVVRALDGVSLAVEAGQRIALVGESGSGKSTLALSTIGLVAPPGRVMSGEIETCGIDVRSATREELRSVRGVQVAMIFQDALGSLNPVMTVGSQLVETIVAHRDLSKEEARVEAVKALDEVGVTAAEARLRQYPHEFSGGMRQRVMIAMALSCRPALLVADEPTTALDVTTQAGIMELLAEVSREREMAVLFITHDLGLVASFADYVLVMYAGVAVEFAAVDAIFEHPRHPYTRLLLRAVPQVGTPRGAELPTIPGSLPSLTAGLPACRFQPRCPVTRGRAECRDIRPSLALSGRRASVACHFPDDADDFVATAALEIGEPVAPSRDVPLLRVEGMVKEYDLRNSWFRTRHRFRAVNDVSFTVGEGESLGLVGESGAGKSTVARVILGLAGSAGGKVDFDSRSLRLGRRRRPGWTDGELQVVFQDPSDSLNPHMAIDRIIAEPMVLLARSGRGGRARRTAELMELVGLDPRYRDARPPQLSGGQKQRVAIARALATNPKLLICDEAVSSLDVSVRAQILNLLKRIQRELGVSYLFITHDLAVVRHVCDRVAVMYRGAIVETADVDALFTAPQHPYTVALLSAVPVPDPALERSRQRVRLPPAAQGAEPRVGCPFRPRCWKAQELCETVAPALIERGDGHLCACHYPEHAEAVVAVESRQIGDFR